MKEEDFILSPDEHRRILEEIFNDFLSKRGPAKTPRAIILGGQPGCGKSSLISSCIREFQGDSVVVINGDELRERHPHYMRILRYDESRMPELTDHDTRSWTKSLFDEAISRRLSVVFEGTLRNIEPIRSTLKHLHELGYSNSLYLIAAHERESLLYVNQRYERQKDLKGFGRKVPIAIHDAAYKQMPETAAELEQKELIDEILVRNTAGRTVYRNKRQNGVWSSPPQVAEAIWSGRERPWTQEEIDRYQDSWDVLLKQMYARKASTDELNEAESIKKRCSKSLEQQAPTQKIPALNPSDFSELESATALLKNPRALDNATFRGYEISIQQNDTLDILEQVRNHVQKDRAVLAKLESSGLTLASISRNKIVRPGQFPNLKEANVLVRTRDSLALVRGRSLYIYELKKLEMKAPAQGVPGEKLDLKWPNGQEKALASYSQERKLLQQHGRRQTREQER